MNTQLFPARQVQRPRQQVESQIREAIQDGLLATGQKLPPEAELAASFGVSRTTVREALRTLVADGMLEKVPGAGGGSFVRRLDHFAFGEDLGHDIQNLLRVGSVDHTEVAQARRMLELPSARLAAENRTQEDLDELKQVLQLEKTSGHDDPAISDLDTRFHSTISRASGNRVAAAFVAALHQVTAPVNHLHLDAEVGRKTYRQHVTIANAIKAGDGAAAEAAMLAHLRYLEDKTSK